MITIGIDPGGKYTGVSVREGDKCLLSSTLVKPDGTAPIAWAVEVTNMVKEIVDRYPGASIGIEGVTVPNAYNQGKLALNSPKYIIRTAIVVGALAVQYPDAVIVRPGKNGSQPISSYPEVLQGRRPKELEGSNNNAGTRNHERSAWDVAGEVEFLLGQKVKLDSHLN